MFKKTISAIALLMLVLTQAHATTQPEKVVSIIKVCKSNAWYVEQAGLWKMRIDKNSADREAWMNYYMAVRMAHYTENGNTKNNLPELNTVVEQAVKAIPNTFEANYMLYRKNNALPDFQYLEKAYELAPERPEVLDEMVYHYEITGDKPQESDFSKKWLNSGDLTQGLLAWNYNMLMSVDQNGVLLTAGDNDTGPALVLQQAKDVRKDIAIINVYLLQTKEYRERIFKELNLPAMPANSENLPIKEWITTVCNHFVTNCTDRPLFFVCDMERAYWNKFSQDLYLTGLAYKYTKDKFDNMATLKRNIDGTFLLDHLRANLTNEPPDANVFAMNQNYLPAMLTLYQHDKESNDFQKAEVLKALMASIVRSTGKENDLKTYLNDPFGGDEHWVSQVKFDAKTFENGMMPVKGNLYAHQTETTNAEYELFLTDLLKQRDFDKLNLCKVYPINWLDSIPQNFPTKDPKIIYENGKPTDANAPVENINYEAAQAYCKWLTQVCNAGTKKRFKKVLFRLPTAQEWEVASRSSAQEDATYPWSTAFVSKLKISPNSPTNSSGCYLANFNATAVAEPKYTGNSKSPCHGNPALDGALFPAGCFSYWPNDFGLYNTIGNVAEMTNEKGIAKGGSWHDKPEDATIKSIQHYTNPTPWLGFRVFMEVIEQ